MVLMGCTVVEPINYYPKKIRIPKLSLRKTSSGDLVLKDTEKKQRECRGKHIHRLCPHKLQMKLIDIGDDFKKWKAEDGCERKWGFIERRFR